jgi:hypothetical protein
MDIKFRLISELGNTPGAWYAVGYFFSALFFLHFNHNTKKGLRKWPVLIALGIFLLAFMHLTTGCYGLYFVFVMTIVGLTIFMIFHHCLEGDFCKKAYYSIRSFMLGEFMASLGWQIYYFGVKNRGVKFDLLHMSISMITVYIIIFGIGILLEKRNATRNRELIIGKRELLMVIIVMFILYAISNLSYVVVGTPFTTQNTLELFMIRTVIDFMAVSLLYLYHELMLQTVERIEAETLKSMYEMQYSQYQIQEENMALVNQKYHDLKHQILALKAGSSEENQEYLDQMLDEIRHYETSYQTGNKVLDTILTSEAMKCQARGIELTCVADGSILSFMNPMDVSSLFGNALDNAIEGAEKIPDKNERLIHLTVDKQKSFVRIFVENRYIGKIRFRHNLPLTSKADTNFHGFGIKSMKSIAEKYGGSIVAVAEDGWFKLSILIPSQN